jgi:uncharacterized protein (TIGR03435 family)
MTRTKTIVLMLVLMAAVVAVKMFFFPSVNEKYFQTSAARLQQAPPGLAVVRPTHYADSTRRSSPQNQFGYTGVNRTDSMVGNNVSFQNLIAAAYNFNPGRVALPAGAPKGNFDFLVTVTRDAQASLQSAIRRELGYTGHVEIRNTPVFALKVENPNSPGLKVSTANQEGQTQKNGRLYFTHVTLAFVKENMEQLLKTPVVDKTGLTNFYDFSLIWDAQTARQIQSGTLDIETGKKILAEWGLGLEPDTETIDMLVVEKAK